MLKRILVLSLIIFLIGGVASAKTTNDISVVSIGARSVAMGGAGVAVIKGASNVFVNPAVISATQAWELTSMSTKLLGIVDYNFLSGNLKTQRGTLGISYVGATSPAGYYTTDENSLATAVPINYSSSVTALSYGVNLSEAMHSNGNSGNLSLGANLKYYQQGFNGTSLSDASGAGASLDIGLLLKARPDLSFGANLQNMIKGNVSWGTGNTDQFSSLTKVGFAKTVEDNLLIAADVDYYFGESRPLTLHAGLEWRPVSLFALRAGVDQDALDANSVATNLCAGIGMNLRGLQLDLAYRQDSSLTENSNFYLSMSYAPYLPKIASYERDTDSPEVLAMGQETNATVEPTQSLDYYRSIGLLK